MKTLKKITLVSFLIGSMMTLSLYSQAQGPTGIHNNTSFITNIPYISAGTDAFMCNGVKYQTSGSTSMSGTTYWLSMGDGIFENPFNLKTAYLPGPNDISDGQVTLRLHIIPQAVGYPLYMDEVVVHLNSCAQERKDEQ